MSDQASKPVIFLAFANDRDDTVGYLRNLPDEARRLREVLEPAEQAGLCEVVVRSNSTASDIFKVFQDPRYRNRIAIFHYGGHANGFQLLLESARGELAIADAAGLSQFLKQQQGLQFAFFNGCATQQQAQGLLDANIPAVITTSRAIQDDVAVDFAFQFYRGLAGGASLRTAFNEAEAAVQTAHGGQTRGLYIGELDDTEEGRWPWTLSVRDGSENAEGWNLPDAVNDPLFGLRLLPEQDLPESPYRHLNRFTREDAEVFFGRGRQIRELYARLTDPRAAPILLFYGQSGVGKSSLLDAGLIPRLEQDYDVRYLRRTEGGLLDTLEFALLPDTADTAMLQVLGLPIDESWRVKEELTEKPLIVFLDQVEELYTRPLPNMPDELDQLLRAVKAIFVDAEQRPQGKLVLGFRKEWLAELESQLAAYELPRSKIFLEPLKRRDIIEVVQGPVRSQRLQERYGLVVEEGLAEIIADDLLEDRESAIAPTLQILLTKLWAKASEENYERPVFSRDLYHELKRDGILLRDFLNQQIAAFRERYPEEVDSGLLLDLVALHTTPLGTSEQRHVEELQQKYAHLDASLTDLLQQCQDLYLLTIATSSQKEIANMTRLAHDTLAPLVREQYEVSDKPGQRARRILDNRSVDWGEGRTGSPLDEADLNVVEQGLRGTRRLNEVEERLLATSRELRAKLHRNRKILRLTSVAAVAVIFVLGVFGWAANQRAEEITAANTLAEKRKDEALAAKELAEEKTDEALEEKQRAEEEKQRADEKTAEAEKNAEAVSQLSDIFASLKLDGSPSGLLGSDYKDPDLVRAAERVQDSFSADDPIKARMLDAIGDHFTMIGQLEAGERFLIEALAIRERNPTAREELASSLHHVGFLRWCQGRIPEAVRLVTRAIKYRTDELGPHHHKTIASQVLYLMLVSETVQLRESKIILAANARFIRCWEEILDTTKDSISPADKGAIYSIIAFSHAYAGRKADFLTKPIRFGQAGVYLTKADQELRRSKGFHPGHLLLKVTMATFREVLPQSKSQPANGYLLEAIELSKQTFHANETHPGNLEIQRHLIAQMHNGPEAEIPMRRLHQQARTVFAGQPRLGNFDFQLAEILYHRALAAVDDAVREQYFQEAEILLGSAIEVWSSPPEPIVWQIAEAKKWHARIAVQRNELPLAESLYREAIDDFESASIRGYQFYDFQARDELSKVLDKLGRAKEATEVRQERERTRNEFQARVPEIADQLFSAIPELGRQEVKTNP